ncbi:unnamed protein product [Brachionus calyciflorus]|uniref:C5orf34-like N-terminal domain-containing protein n=1 Tax=Brachionus calyciflorus TaxID=104777 RepID=A0A814A9S6_9BILA|nr:unnamed protein product [Brachionus calyciflorus]
MEVIKYMVIYLDNSCEVHFSDNCRILLSPCASEFIYRVYDTDNTIQSTFKYRTAYPLSMFSTRLSLILKYRNRFCENRPFISPILLETCENSSWMSTDDFQEAKWDVREMSLKMTNPIEKDYNNFFYVWKSMCKNVEFKIHFNKKLVVVKYPVKVPKSLDDEFEQKCDINNTILQINKNKKNFVSKHLFKYTWNEQEFSICNIPPIWNDIYLKMLQLIDGAKESESENCEFLNIKIPEAMPLSCQSTHLHKFDNIETASEPKVIYINETWYKLFYKTKSIEIMCPQTKKEVGLKQEIKELDSNINSAIELESFQDYLISDSTSGRYYTCFSLNRRTGDVEEIKICVDNIPAFKTYLQKTLNYSNIILKRIDSIRCISNYSSCYINKKIEEIEPTKLIDDLLEKQRMLNQTDNKTISSDSSSSSTTNSSKTSFIDFESINLNIKKQFYIKDIGHFKLMRNNSIVIHFIDRIKLFMDENSLNMFLKNNLTKSFCLLYLPDYSEHEVCLGENEPSAFFDKYLNFLDQWLNWLLDNKILKKIGQKEEENINEEQNLNISSLHSHLKQLKNFNSSVSKQIKNEDIKCDSIISSNSIESIVSVNYLLKENNFLKNISK